MSPDEPKPAPVKFFLDCEFMEDGKTIYLLSIALVREDGRDIYLVSNEADHTKANSWVGLNVLPQLFNHMHNSMDFRAHCSRRAMIGYISKFIGPNKPQFWGYYADYDWVAFCQLFGTMMDLPKGFPMYCRDIKQLCDALGNPELPPQGKGEHHALQDARWNKKAYEFLKTEEPSLVKMMRELADAQEQSAKNKLA
jgi:hypothetical protein